MGAIDASGKFAGALAAFQTFPPAGLSQVFRQFFPINLGLSQK